MTIHISHVRAGLYPPFWPENTRVLPKDGLVEMDDCWVHAYARIPGDPVPANLASARWGVAGEWNPGDRVHSDPLLNAGPQIGELSSLGVRDVRPAQLVARNRSVDLRSEVFVDGSIAEDVVEDAGQSQGCCLASGEAVAVS